MGVMRCLVCCREMERITLRGNSLARGLEVDGVRVVAEGGAKLAWMMDRAEEERREGVTVFLFGIPDLFKRGQWEREERGAKAELLRVMRRAEGRAEWVLGTFFPPRGASQALVQVVRAVNALATHINAENGNGTPAFHTFMFFREGPNYIIKRSMYADEVHWTDRAKRVAEQKVEDWLRAREQRGHGGALGRREAGVRREQDVGEARIRARREECEAEIAEYGRRRREECEREIETIREDTRRRVDRIRRDSPGPGRWERREIGRGLRWVPESPERVQGRGRGRGDLRQALEGRQRRE